jgi:hypothetical protein
MASLTTRNDASQAAIRHYELFCLVGLLIMLVVLMGRGYGPWSVLPLLVGAAGIMGRWRMALPLTLLALVFVFLDFWRVRGFHRNLHDFDPLGDFLLCIAVLGYASGQLRLQGLARPLVPVVPGGRRSAEEGKHPPPRTSLVDAEIPLLIASLPVCAWMAGVLWEELPPDWNYLGLPIRFQRLMREANLAPAIWRLIVLIWILGSALLLRLVLRAILGWRGSGADTDEAVMYLQDVLWRETRREQTRLQRWLAWTRLRADRRKERS